MVPKGLEFVLHIAHPQMPSQLSCHLTTDFASYVLFSTHQDWQIDDSQSTACAFQSEANSRQVTVGLQTTDTLGELKPKTCRQPCITYSSFQHK